MKGNENKGHITQIIAQ